MSSRVQLLSGALASRYTIKRELGSGGMATVYLAEDLKHHRQVAVKVLHPELTAVLGSDRFLVDSWNQADERYQPLVIEGRRRIAELAGEPIGARQ